MHFFAFALVRAGVLQGSELGKLQSKLLRNIRKLLRLVRPGSRSRKRVSDFAHFLPARGLRKINVILFSTD